jgi:hypothetical protein
MSTVVPSLPPGEHSRESSVQINVLRTSSQVATDGAPSMLKTKCPRQGRISEQVQSKVSIVTKTNMSIHITIGRTIIATVELGLQAALGPCRQLQGRASAPRLETIRKAESDPGMSGLTVGVASIVSSMGRHLRVRNGVGWASSMRQKSMSL